MFYFYSTLHGTAIVQYYYLLDFYTTLYPYLTFINPI